MLRSNTRGVYKADTDDQWVAHHPEIQRIAKAIEERRIALNKTSGFERLCACVTKLYFGGMKRHLAELRPLLRPGASLTHRFLSGGSFCLKVSIGSKRSPMVLTRRRTSLASNLRARWLWSAFFTSFQVTGVETVGVSLARRE